jgi:hypothetical protein
VQLVADARANFGIGTPWSQAIEAAINPDDHECSNDTDFGRWAEETFGQIEPASLDLIFGVGVDFWAFANIIAFDQDASDEYMGIDGQHTKELQKRHRKGHRFCDVATSRRTMSCVRARKGRTSPTTPRWCPVLLSFGFPAADAQFFVDLVQQVIIDDPALEFAHHVKGELGVLDSVPFEPEAPRPIELMADTFAAYNLAHARGASFQTKRIVDIVSASFNIGDCGFDDPGHHGTPNQREAAAAWGADLANSAHPQGKIKSATTMLELFDAQLPRLIAPDAG